MGVFAGFEVWTDDALPQDTILIHSGGTDRLRDLMAQEDAARRIVEWNTIHAPMLRAFKSRTMVESMLDEEDEWTED